MILSDLSNVSEAIKDYEKKMTNVRAFMSSFRAFTLVVIKSRRRDRFKDS